MSWIASPKIPFTAVAAGSAALLLLTFGPDGPSRAAAGSRAAATYGKGGSCVAGHRADAH
ncbi:MULTISPECIES: hypothetical protein [Mesorhizobium]|uniref:hypothetical protein n=1 Tax=Mesorhizobium sp. TaxID=1871066 RepID=UPI001F120BF1|nr:MULTISPECIES: hypothetical protein [Mesorhizobium]